MLTVPPTDGLSGRSTKQTSAGPVLSTVYSRDVRFPPKEAHVGVSTKESEIMNSDDRKHRSHLPDAEHDATWPDYL